MRGQRTGKQHRHLLIVERLPERPTSAARRQADPPGAAARGPAGSSAGRRPGERLQHLLRTLGLQDRDGRGDVTVDGQDRRRLRGHERRAVGRAERRPAVGASSLMAPTSREISSSRSCSGAERAAAADDRPDERLPDARPVAPALLRRRARASPGSRSARGGATVCASAAQMRAGPPRARRTSRSSVNVVRKRRSAASGGGGEQDELQHIAVVQQGGGFLNDRSVIRPGRRRRAWLRRHRQGQ